MTWIIHKADRNRIYNSSAFEEVNLCGEIIYLMSKPGDLLPLKYDTAQEAKTAYGYLMEAIKRGDWLVHI